MEQISVIQLKKLKKIFRRTGKTFQTIAEEAGLSNIPDHAVDLTRIEARQILKTFGYCLASGKMKQGE